MKPTPERSTEGQIYDFDPVIIEIDDAVDMLPPVMGFKDLIMGSGALVLGMSMLTAALAGIVPKEILMNIKPELPEAMLVGVASVGIVAGAFIGAKAGVFILDRFYFSRMDC